MKRMTHQFLSILIFSLITLASVSVQAGVSISFGSPAVYPYYARPVYVASPAPVYYYNYSPYYTPYYPYGRTIIYGHKHHRHVIYRSTPVLYRYY